MSESNAADNEDVNLQAFFDAYMNSEVADTGDILSSMGSHPELNTFAMLDLCMYPILLHVFQFTHFVSGYLVRQFPNLPDNWTRVMCHAYNDVFNSICTEIPRISLQSSVPRAIHRATARCIASNPNWAPNEHGEFRVYSMISVIN